MILFPMIISFFHSELGNRKFYLYLLFRVSYTEIFLLLFF